MTLFITRIYTTLLLTFCISQSKSDESDTSVDTSTLTSTEMFPYFSSTEIDCDEIRSSDWNIDYIGQSTQFKVYNPCHNNEFIKIKMSDLTEYDENGKKTKNKIPTFASTDWNWNNPDGINTKYEGYSVLQNVFEAKNILQGSNFMLSTLLFKEDARINNSTDIDSNSLKWNINITAWPFLSDLNSLELCINIMTNKANENNDLNDQEHGHWRVGDFDLYTFDSAECKGSNESIKVSIQDNVKGDSSGKSGQRNICFRFGHCASGSIFYDPIISYLGDIDGVEDDVLLARAVKLAVVIIASILSVALIFWFFIGYQCYKKKKILKQENYVMIQDEV